MKRLNYLAVAIIGLFFCGTKHQDQTFNEHVFIGADDGQPGEGKRLYFGGASENEGDPFWISRFDRGVNLSDLRVNISDDEGGDRFVIGTNWYSDSQFHPYFVVQSNGRVGIGTEIISDERLAVNGKIRAKEVKIEANTWDTPWPDYVFKPTYKLASLTSVKAYIDKNQHLPDMPSEYEVAKEGINLGEMNKLLLKKVEELTLYLIEKDKENKELSLRLNKLEKKAFIKN